MLAGVAAALKPPPPGKEAETDPPNENGLPKAGGLEGVTPNIGRWRGGEAMSSFKAKPFGPIIKFEALRLRFDSCLISLINIE